MSVRPTDNPKGNKKLAVMEAGVECRGRPQDSGKFLSGLKPELGPEG